MTREYDAADSALKSAMARSSGRSTREILAERAQAEHLAAQADPRRRDRPTPGVEVQARVERSAAAWRETRAKVQGWPADLAARALQACADRFGAEPNTATAAAGRQAEALVRQLPGDGEPERPAADVATAEQAWRLLEGSGSSDRGEAARRAKATSGR